MNGLKKEEPRRRTEKSNWNSKMLILKGSSISCSDSDLSNSFSLLYYRYINVSRQKINALTNPMYICRRKREAEVMVVED